MIKVDWLNREITELLNQKRCDEADQLIRESIQLLSQTRGWIMHYRNQRCSA